MSHGVPNIEYKICYISIADAIWVLLIVNTTDFFLHKSLGNAAYLLCPTCIIAFLEVDIISY